MEPKDIWYDIYDGKNKMVATRDKKSADRRVFAENCSYRNEKDKTWHVKKRGDKEMESA